jgi:hypothetical protein
MKQQQKFLSDRDSILLTHAHRHTTKLVRIGTDLHYSNKPIRSRELYD